MMDINDYSAKLHDLEEATAKNLADLGAWTEHVALPWLWSELGGAILAPKQRHPMATGVPARPTLKPMKHEEAVRQGLMTSVAERRTKESAASFYQAQLTMMDSEAIRYCQSIARFGAAPLQFAPEAVIHTLHRALLEIMSYARVLLEDAAREVTDVPGYFAAWRSKRDHPFEVFKGAEQNVYGTYSGMTHTDRAPYVSVAVLRTAIELRLRHAFCIYSVVSPNNPEDSAPIDMSSIFMAIQAVKGKIEFAVDVHDVWRIYRWSNFYLHGGLRDFPWVAGFLLQYLRPLFLGPDPKPNGAWSMNGGIQLSRATWRAVRADAAAGRKKLGFRARAANAWKALFPSKKSRALELPEYDEKTAHCVFLD